uniref:thioredoxin domain-containing protein n=1 Tax=Roseobacter sp. HKCCA0434 TaxID=3079297 RepID=UPI0029059DCE
MRALPGVTRGDDEQIALEAALAARGPGYVPRTHLMDGDGPRYVNRLIHEASPYLVQHAHNPVDWRPWGPEALAEATARDLPVFLSVGYATCHWCHVMEEESFDDEEVAALLNTAFVPVKLDREQRPDVDQVYILATMLQHRHAGWPNSQWLMPDGRPFHTGTYFPKPQFLQVLGAIAQGWDGGQRAQFESVARQLSEAMRRIPAETAPPAALDAAPAAALADLARLFNAEQGGFSHGTQFPQEGHLLFLLDHWRRTGDAAARDMALRSLEAMVAGGLHDHVGGGFHRYTVDVNWRTPHFEKMLYNQALMLRALVEGWQAGGDPALARAAARLVAYIARDMTAADGAFYAAEDADSLEADGRREEGAFYVWPPEAAPEAARDVLNLHAAPTLEAGPVAHLTPGEPVEFDALDPLLEEMRLIRDARPRPLRDEKVIAGWNGLLIRALAEAAIALDRPDWTEMAERAFDAVMARLGPLEELARLDFDGKRREVADLSDHAWLGLAAFALGRIDLADAFAARLLERFDHDGRLVLSPEGPLGPVLETEDGATPSGEAGALELLALLAEARPDPVRDARARALRDAVSGR